MISGRCDFKRCILDGMRTGWLSALCPDVLIQGTFGVQIELIVIHFRLKLWIPIKIVERFVTGRSLGNLPPNFFIQRSYPKSSHTHTTVSCRPFIRKDCYISRKSVTTKGSRSDGFALVGPIVRFTFPVRIIVAGQIISSFLNRQNSSVPRIEP